MRFVCLFNANDPNTTIPTLLLKKLEMAAASYRRIKTTDARNEFGWIVDHVAHGKERVILERRGRSLAAIIPMEDLRFLEAAFSKVEDALDIRDSDRALAEDAELIPYEQIQKDLGLKGSKTPVRATSRKATAAAAKKDSRTRQRKVVGIGKSAVSKRNGKAAR